MTYDLETLDWIYRPPSRRLRKLYAALDALYTERDIIRMSNPVPDHAPSSCVLVSRQLHENRLHIDRLLVQIDRWQNPSEPERRRPRPPDRFFRDKPGAV